MRCANCGKEIPDNSSYCLYCHAPTEASTDIDVNIDILEDDELLGAFQKQEQQRIHQIEIKDQENEPKKKKTLIISMVGFICGFGILALVSASYLSSYTYIISKANKAYNNGDYENAYKLYEKALDKNPESVEALVGAGEAAAYTGKYNESENYLTKALDIDGENSKAYNSLLDLYTTKDDQEKIIEAEKYASTDEMKESFNEIAIEAPTFSEAGGEFEDDVNLILSSKSNLQIYYTLDGKDPTNGDGTLFTDDIKLTEGKTIVKAACYKKGTFGPVSEQTYVIKYNAPGFPSISPMNGSFTEPTKITIRSDVPGARIFYTWDGSTPTTKSEKYSGPIDVPEGNNVLSVIVVNSNGKASDVLCCSYTYLPAYEEDPDETDETETIPDDAEVLENPNGHPGINEVIVPDNENSDTSGVGEYEYIFDEFWN